MPEFAADGIHETLDRARRARAHLAEPGHSG